MAVQKTSDRGCFGCANPYHKLAKCPAVKRALFSDQIHYNDSKKLCWGAEGFGGKEIQLRGSACIMDVVWAKSRAERAKEERKLVAIKMITEKPSSNEQRQLMTLPPEIRNIILENVLRHPHPIRVDAFWVPKPLKKWPTVDFRVLFACKKLWNEGWGIYLASNTWCIDSFDFSHWSELTGTDQGSCPDPAESRWPLGTGHQLQAAWLKQLIVSKDTVFRAKDAMGWANAGRLLRGFTGLEQVTFDCRLPGDLEWPNNAAESMAGQRVWDLVRQCGVALAALKKITVVAVDEEALEEETARLKRGLAAAAHNWNVTLGLVEGDMIRRLQPEAGDLEGWDEWLDRPF